METLNKINIESPTEIKINKRRKRINKKYPQKGSGFFGIIGSGLAKAVKGVGSAGASITKKFASGVTSPIRHAITRRRLIADMAKKRC